MIPEIINSKMMQELVRGSANVVRTHCEVVVVRTGMVGRLGGSGG